MGTENTFLEDFPMQKQKIIIPAEVGELEGQISVGTNDQEIGIVVCHPHPQFGGTMTNNVSGAIFHHFSALGYPTLRFNFRGVGMSSGSFSNGVGERQDVKDACGYLLRTVPHINKILIMGYSYGAAIGTSIVNDLPEIIGFVAISYPFTFISDFIPQSYTDKTKLFFIGDRDDFTPLPIFKKEYSKYTEPKKIHIVPNTDHFWNNKEKFITDKIEEWLKNVQI